MPTKSAVWQLALSIAIHLAFLGSSLLIGFFLAICLVAVLAVLWIYRFALVRFITVPAPSGPRPRLARYLE